MMLKRMAIGIVSLVIVAVAIVACGRLQDKQRPPESGEEHSIQVKTEALSPMPQKPYGPPTMTKEGDIGEGLRVFGRTEVIAGSGWYYNCGTYDTLSSPAVKSWWKDMGWESPRECCDYLLEQMFNDGWRWNYDYKHVDSDGNPVFLEGEADLNQEFRDHWLELLDSYVEKYRD